jgi:hypothetical protein
VVGGPGVPRDDGRRDDVRVIITLPAAA